MDTLIAEHAKLEQQLKTETGRKNPTLYARLVQLTALLTSSDR